MQLENRAEVALLNRSIQVQGANADFGGRILIAPGAAAAIQGVRISGCGQSAASHPALQILEAQSASVRNCTVQASRASGIQASGTDGLYLESNVIVGSLGSSVSVIDSPNAR